MPPQSVSLARKLSSWNQYNREQYIIIFTFIRGMSYPNLLFVANINSLKDRRDKYSRSFFQKMCNPVSHLHHLLPPPRITSVTFRLRSTTPLPHPTSQSFNHLQISPSVNTNHLYNSTIILVVSLFLVCAITVAICTYVLMNYVILHLELSYSYLVHCLHCTIISYSAIFIAASVQINSLSLSS